MSRNRTAIFALLGLTFGLITWMIPFVLPQAVTSKLVDEDQLIEYLTFLLFLTSGFCWLAAFIFSKTRTRILRWHSGRNLAYLFLAVLLLFGAGEEISWGQRLVGFETPTFMAGNEQGEFNVHNLPEFSARNAMNYLSLPRLFLYFLVVFGTVIPLLASLSSRFGDFASALGIPVVPLALGAQFLLYYGLSKLYAPWGINPNSYSGLLVEIRECQNAFMLALIALNVLLDKTQPAESVEPDAITLPSRTMRLHKG